MLEIYYARWGMKELHWIIIMIRYKLITCQLLYLTNTYKPREILLTINGQKKMLCLKKYGTIRGLGLLDWIAVVKHASFNMTTQF